MDASQRDGSDLLTDFHPGRTGVEADLLYYDPWSRRRKLSKTATMSHVRETRVVSGNIPDGWEHPQNVTTWIPQDKSYNYTGVVTSIAHR